MESLGLLVSRTGEQVLGGGPEEGFWKKPSFPGELGHPEARADSTGAAPKPAGGSDTAVCTRG